MVGAVRAAVVGAPRPKRRAKRQVAADGQLERGVPLGRAAVLFPDGKQAGTFFINGLLIDLSGRSRKRQLLKYPVGGVAELPRLPPGRGTAHLYGEFWLLRAKKSAGPGKPDEITAVHKNIHLVVAQNGRNRFLLRHLCPQTQRLPRHAHQLRNFQRVKPGGQFAGYSLGGGHKNRLVEGGAVGRWPVIAHSQQPG